MELAQLETFAAVAQEKGFARAAARVHRTQSAVSQSVRRLEDELGTPLFDRSSKGGTLTEAGRVLYGYAQQMQNLARASRAALQELESLQAGKVTLAVNEYTIMHLVPVLVRFRARHPRVRVEIQRSFASRIPSEILERAVEIGAVTYRPAQAGLTAVPMATDALALLVAPGHRLAGRAVVSVAELGRETFLAHNQRSPYRERVVRTFERHRTPLHIGMELPTLESIKRLVELGQGVALMPRRAAEFEVLRGTLAALTVREMRHERTVHLVYRGGAQLSHAARAFLSCARERGGPAPAGRARGQAHD
jgi:DNA-binding transcriptional LysR family regulator